jgi:hypothetical protein
MHKVKVTAMLTLLLMMTMIPMILPPTVNASPTTYTVKTYLHNIGSSKSIVTGLSSQYIMNTTTSWSSTNQTRTISASNTTYGSVYFYLYPKLAGTLTVNGNVTISVYLKADSSRTSVKFITELHKTNNATAGWTQIGSTVTNTISLGTTEALKTSTHASISTTIAAGYTVRLNITIGLSAEAGSYTATVVYDTAVRNSRVTWKVEDHIQVTAVNTYIGSRATTEFNWDDTINITATVKDAFGGYDISTVKIYCNPADYPTTDIPTGKGTGSRISGSDTSYTNIYQYLLNASSYSDYAGQSWTPKAYATDNGGSDTSTYSGSRIWITGTSGQGPPPTWWWEKQWEEFMRSMALLPLQMMLTMILLVALTIILVVVVVLYIKRSK